MDSPMPGTKPAGGCAMGLTLLVAGASYLVGLPIVAWGLKAAFEQALDRGSTLAALFGGFALVWGVPRLWLACGPAVIRVTWRNAVAAAPDLALAGAFLATWAHPPATGDGSVKTMSFLVILEFLIIHASIGLGTTLANRDKAPKWKRGFWALVAVYLLFAGALAVGSRSAWPVIAIAGLTANKFSAAILDPRASGASPRQMAQWAMQTACFLFFGFASGFLPVPPLGVTETLGEGSGQWGEEPYRALAAGAAYFAMLGFIELYGGVGKDRPTPDPSDAVVHAA